MSIFHTELLANFAAPCALGGLNHSDLVAVRSPLASCDLILLAAKVVQIALKEGKGYVSHPPCSSMDRSKFRGRDQN